MRKILALILTMGLASGGCAWFGGSSSEEVKPAQPQEQTAAPEPAPALEVEVPIYFFLAFSIARLTGCGN